MDPNVGPTMTFFEIPRTVDKITYYQKEKDLKSNFYLAYQPLSPDVAMLFARVKIQH